MPTNIEKSIWTALRRLFKRDAELLRYDVNERTITHKLAQYLEPEFPEWDVDCEYNRNHDKTKRLKYLPGKLVSLNNTDGTSVFPDIIVHKRMTDENYVVIEVKKSTSNESPAFDQQKLLAFKIELHYRFAVFVRIATGSEEMTATVEWV